MSVRPIRFRSGARGRVSAAVALALALGGAATPATAATPAAAMPAAAPGAADTLRLSLDQAVALAMSQGEEMRLANASVSVANGQVREAMAAALPQISGSLTYDRRFASVFQSVGPDTGIVGAIAGLFKETPFASVHSWSADVTASQLLWSGGRVGSGLAAARAYRRSVRAGRDETAADIALQVERAYLEAAYARRVLEISRAGLEQSRAHLAQVKLFQSQGSRSEYDLIRAQVDAANQEPPVVAARNASELAMLDLRRLIDLPLDQPVALVTPLAFEDGLVPVVEDASDDPSARPALIRADADVEGRRDLLRLERAARWPQLTLSSTLSQQAFPPIERPRLDEFHRNLDASLKLEFPLFLGFKTFGAVERATAELRQAQVQRDLLREQVRLDVARARQEVRRTLAEMVARRGTAQLAERAHHLAEVRYTNGLATQLEVTDARLQMQTSLIQEVQAVKDYRLALLELERSLGRRVQTVRRPLDQIAASMNDEE
jgi:outer membrane protein TolC